MGGETRTCASCGTVLNVVPCSNCEELTCPDCKAGPSPDKVAAPFEVFCCDDCRDGVMARTAMRLDDCRNCRGMGEVIVVAGLKSRHPERKRETCYDCNGTGKRSKAPPPAVLKGALAEAARNDLQLCPDCEGRYEFNSACCATCNGKGAIPY